jgi:hypothetical protein
MIAVVIAILVIGGFAMLLASIEPIQCVRPGGPGGSPRPEPTLGPCPTGSIGAGPVVLEELGNDARTWVAGAA